jgi:radical SAM protein with 4Fe4S-binding SPASM domain
MNNHLTAVSWIINNECNLHCIYCYTNSGPGREIRPSYSREEIEDLGISIGTVSPKIVFISGGEPLLDRDLFIFIRVARQIADKELWICSNGTLISDDFLIRAKSEGVDGFSLSLQHTDPVEEDAIRGGKDVYAKVIEAIKKIKNANFKLALETTITSQNYNIIDDIIQIGVEFGIDLILFKRFRPIGRGRFNQHLALSPKENQAILHHIFQRAIQLKSVKIKVDDPLYSLLIYKHLRKTRKNSNNKLPAYMQRLRIDRSSIIPSSNACGALVSFPLKDEPSQRYWGCKAGVEWVGIDPFGNVGPCPLMLYAGVVIGNIKSAPLNEIINNSQEIKMLRNIYTRGSCQYSKICGGCRSHAAILNNNYLGKDPMCLYGGTC